jgi:hypothetical protein
MDVRVRAHRFVSMLTHNISGEPQPAAILLLTCN